MFFIYYFSTWAIVSDTNCQGESQYFFLQGSQLSPILFCKAFFNTHKWIFHFFLFLNQIYFCIREYISLIYMSVLPPNL